MPQVHIAESACYHRYHDMIRCISHSIMICLQATVRPIAELNAAVQSRRSSLSAMVEAMKTSTSYLQSVRNEEHFKCLFDACDLCQKLDLTVPHLPRQRRPPQQFMGPAATVQWSSAEEYFRAEFCAVLDVATSGLEMRCNQPGIARYCQLEHILFETVRADEVHDTVKDYPELSSDSLLVQLTLVSQQHCNSGALTPFWVTLRK